MDNKILDFGQGQKENFMLAIEPETGVPCWFTQKDEIWLMAVGSGLYDYASAHPIVITGSNLADKHEFTYTFDKEVFRTAILSGQVAKFRDIVLMLSEAKLNIPAPLRIKYGTTNVTFAGGNSEYILSAIVDNGVVRIDGVLK